MVLDVMTERGHEQVTYFSEPDADLRAIVAVHDTTLGPALGGTRVYDYGSEAAALEDAARLSRAMTYKAATADLDLGGGKAVIVGDPAEVKDEALFRAYGRAVDSLAGRYVTSVDVNTTVDDMDVIADETEHVSGTSDGLGDPSPVTAHGARHAIEACLEHLTGVDTVADREILVQGLGKVGSHLAADLAERGAAVTVSDIDPAAVESFTDEYDADTVDSGDVYGSSCDVFVPCAVGGVVNDETVPQLACDAVVGVANNVLAEERHATALSERDILYAPDYVVNAGGLITVAQEYRGGTLEAAYDAAAGIGDRLSVFLAEADSADTTVLAVARQYAERRLAGTDDRTPSSRFPETP